MLGDCGHVLTPSPRDSGTAVRTEAVKKFARAGNKAARRPVMASISFEKDDRCSTKKAAATS